MNYGVSPPHTLRIRVVDGYASITVNVLVDYPPDATEEAVEAVMENAFTEARVELHGRRLGK